MKVLNSVSDGLKREYTVLVSPDEVETTFAEKLKDKAAKTRMDGFRPGKVPVDIIRRVYGDSLRGDAVRTLLRSTGQKIIQDEELRISFDFSTNIIKEDENGIEFSLKFEIIPEVDINPVYSIELTKYVAEITEKEVNEILDDVRLTHKKWEDQPEDFKAETGNKVNVDMQAKLELSNKKGKNAKHEKNSVATAMDIVIGDPEIAEDFWKPLEGKKVGDVVSFDVTYPKNLSDPTLAGKTVNYTATVKKVSIASEYNLDDEFAKSVGYSDFEALHKWAEDRAKMRYENLSQSILKRHLLEKIASMYEFEVPQNMYNIEYSDVHRQLSGEAQRLGKTMNEEAEAECKNIAASRVRLGFIVAELSKKNDITVTRKEITDEIRSLAALYPGHERAIWDMYSHGTALSAIVGPILEKKVVDFLFKTIKIIDKTSTPEEIIALDEETFDFFKDETEVSIEKLQDLSGTTETADGDTKENNDQSQVEVAAEENTKTE